jgi:hypothetical protein
LGGMLGYMDNWTSVRAEVIQQHRRILRAPYFEQFKLCWLLLRIHAI